VLDRPLGTDFIPLETAAIIYIAMLLRDWNDLIALRAELDPEVWVLNDLHRRDTLTEATIVAGPVEGPTTSERISQATPN
jgi:hypothetical protein